VEFNENYFYVTFRQSEEYLKLAGKAEKEVTEKVTVKVIERIAEKVTENQKRILKEIRKDKYTTAQKLSLAVGISRRKVQENIKKLKEKGLLKRVGPDRGGYCEIVGKV
jgi:ATP-dependent DNA helicase RecG